MDTLHVGFMNQIQINSIANEFHSCVERTIVRIANDNGHRPFHVALLSEEALFWSKFERSFSTSFGQRVIEKISETVAISGGATKTETQKRTVFNIPNSKLNAIEHHITELRSGRTRGSWDSDWQNIDSIVNSLDTTEIRVISDLWWVVDGVNHYMSIKTVKPNIDQTAEAKKDLLKLKVFDPDCRVYFGLYYNPFGDDRDSYNWSPPMRIFDFRNDDCVLIGEEYWDVLGGEGTYNSILDIANKVGVETIERLRTLRG